MQQAEELNLESTTAVSTIPKQPDENPPDDDIIIIPSWLEVVDDIYSTLPAQLPATDDNEELLLQEDDHHDHFQMMENHHIMFDFETNVDVDSAHLLQAPLPTVPADQIDPPLFFLDDHDLYEYLLFHENVPDIDDDDQRTQLPQYSLLQNPQPHVESRSENELDACNIFLLDNDDELLINDLVNINTKENIHDQDNTSEHYHVNNVTTTTTTSTVMPSSNDDHHQVGTSEPRTTDEQIKELGHVRGDEENEADPNSRNSTLNGCKNLVSERNRRTRLSQQLLALRALVPNITKMDKRSVLVDALAYLRSIHEETTRLQKELNEHHQPNLNSIMISTATAPTPNDNEIEFFLIIHPEFHTC
ncbi:Myc-type [Macleaya cordata]|uniref:Myc-type n=1 Tax=Macleaya cordata TaxID=56857 RepID=A0A200QDP9_MACCD|nr:Myc-type [Macleaya cordata]